MLRLEPRLLQQLKLLHVPLKCDAVRLQDPLHTGAALRASM